MLEKVKLALRITTDAFDEELEDLTLEDIDTILNESKDKETQQKEKSNSDLINQILKEMEIEKENK